MEEKNKKSERSHKSYKGQPDQSSASFNFFDPEVCPSVRRLLEEYRLSRNAAAKNHLMELGLPLVRQIASNYTGFLLGDLDDVTATGLIGLNKAIKAWRPDKSKSWLHYAVVKIRGEILAELNRQKRATLYNPKDNMPWLTCEDGAESFHLPDERLPGERLEASDCFQSLVANLADQERAVLECLYWSGMSLEETANHLGIDESAVRRALCLGLAVLRGRIVGKETQDAGTSTEAAGNVPVAASDFIL